MYLLVHTRKKYLKLSTNVENIFILIFYLGGTTKIIRSSFPVDLFRTVPTPHLPGGEFNHLPSRAVVSLKPRLRAALSHVATSVIPTLPDTEPHLPLSTFE